jgi:hypothetical protein
MRIAFVSVFVLCAAPAVAQGAQPLDKVYACARMADSAARLACYDAAVAGLKKAQSGGDVAVVSRSQIQKAEKDAFGLQRPALAELVEKPAPAAAAAAAAAAPDAADIQSPDKVMLAIKQVSTGSDGRYRIVMENGQVWRQTDEVSLERLKDPGLTAEIRKAALGTFMMKIGNRKAIRVKRVE